LRCIGLLTLQRFVVPTRILIVDDSLAMRRAIRLLLESQASFEVCGEAVDGLEAVEKTVELKPDVIVMDYSMPRMNGLEAAAAVREIVPQVPIILFTLHKDAVSSHKAHDAGIAAIVSKADHVSKLSEEILRLAGPGVIRF
jgi:two-component system, NarL family, response regulator NreC